MIERQDLARALRFGAIVGVVFGAIDIVYSWLAPLSDDSIGALLRFYGPMFAAWGVAAYRAARRDGRVSSGFVTGAVVAASTFAVFVLMNLLRVNLFLEEMTGRADWERMMALYRASHAESLRGFIVWEYVKDTPLKIAVASAIGAVIGVIGGSAAVLVRQAPRDQPRSDNRLTSAAR